MEDYDSDLLSLLRLVDHPLAQPPSEEGKAPCIHLPGDPEVLHRKGLAEDRQHKEPPRLPDQGEALQQDGAQGLPRRQHPLQEDPGPEVQGHPTHAQEAHSGYDRGL